MNAKRRVELMGRKVVVTSILKRKKEHRERSIKKWWEACQVTPFEAWIVGFSVKQNGFSVPIDYGCAWQAKKAVPCLLVREFPNGAEIPVPLDSGWSLVEEG